jgi:hypothetical protein
MTPPRTSPPRRRRSLVAIDGVLAIIVIVLVVQMWLLSATLAAFLNGRYQAALPGAIVSIVLAAACAALARMIQRVDRGV